MPSHGPTAKQSRFTRLRERNRKVARGRTQGQAKKLQQVKKMMVMRSGPVTRNPFLNFMREFREKNSNLSFTEMGVEAGKCWRAMKAPERKVYKQMAQSTPKKERK